MDFPAIGLGTSGNTDHEQCAHSVRTALELGYRHVDTAQMYDNEAAVGEGIKRADVERDEVALATKILPANLAPEDVERTFTESLDRLDVDYVDLLYVHWPLGAYDAERTLPAVDALADDGRVEQVCVSNFTPELLDEARDVLDNRVFAHQVEMHPLLQQRHLVEYAQDHDHLLVAYCPLLQGEAGDVPELREVADRHDATPEQVSLAWLVAQDNVVPIPKATGEQHIRENLAARDLTLTGEDHELIAGVDRENRLVDPDGAAWN